MSTQVVKCSNCGMRFNGTEYAQCPYCQEQKDGVEKGKKWPWHKGKPVQPKLLPPELPGEPDRPEPKRAVDSGGQGEVDPPAQPWPTGIPDPPAQPWPTGIPDPLSPGLPGEPDRPGPGQGVALGSDVAVDLPWPAGASDRCPTDSKRVGPTQPFWEPTPEPEAEEPRPEKKIELKKKIQELGPTTAKYINTSGGDVTYPAVGWLVCVKGIYYGMSFPLKSGINTVGRSPDMDVPLLLDQSVSRKIAVRIGYDSRANAFHAWAGESSEFCVISGNTLYERVPLAGFEEIEFGDTGASKYLFVPLCGDRFQWSDYPSQS